MPMSCVHTPLCSCRCLVFTPPCVHAEVFCSCRFPLCPYVHTFMPKSFVHAGSPCVHMSRVPLVSICPVFPLCPCVHAGSPCVHMSRVHACACTCAHLNVSECVHTCMSMVHARACAACAWMCQSAAYRKRNSPFGHVRCLGVHGNATHPLAMYAAWAPAV